MLRLKPPWRPALAGVAPPEYAYPDYVYKADDLEYPTKDEDKKNGNRDGSKSLSREEATTNKNMPESFALDDPSGNDFKEGAPNYSEAFSLEFARHRRIVNTFALIISKIAEDLAGWPVDGDDEWSIQELMSRRLTLAPLSRCRQSREKESVVLILDTSGSCLPQAVFYNQIAGAAVESGDIELYAAPNAGLEARRDRRGWKAVEQRAWPFHGRTIIFFGDYDGGDAVVEASWRNKVYWFCSEGTRYPSMKLHPWCSYPFSFFRGVYYDCLNKEDFVRLLRKVR